ncbi:MAG TPA: carboxypeptidase-like regulatory domain-containing protein, partial [Vicinamibacterales bacterium]|nr:carboxypeptidase-like regulatory domain-containing protein [Vicinamibacterales bacterium]
MTKKTMFLISCVAVLMALALAHPAGAQVTSAAIVGTITDSSGGALPGVTVTARNIDTGFNRTVPTDEVGAYRLDFLPIGKYTVELELSGFKTVSRSG